MTNFYFWLKFGHLAGLAAFLFGHGIAAGCSYGLRRHRTPGADRALLQLSVWSSRIAYPGLLLLIATGIGMGFAGHWWGQGWIWASVAILVALFVGMGLISLPYHRARDAGDDDTALYQQLDRTRPITAAWMGGAGLVGLILLMVFKPF